MSKIYKLIDMDIYVFKAKMHNGSVKTIGIGAYRKDQFITQMDALAFMRRCLTWSIDILTF